MNFERAVQTIINMIRDKQDEAGRTFTLAEIDDVCEASIASFAGMNPRLRELRLEIKKRVLAAVKMRITDGATLSGRQGSTPWLDERRKSEIKWVNWESYKEVGLGHLGKSADAIGDDSFEILSQMPDPAGNGLAAGRGLVMGDIQSGKTANYIALAAMALDAGYKGVIVLTGVHESLRVQTQNRINTGLIHARRVHANHREFESTAAVSLTDTKSDFAAAHATRQLTTMYQPYVIVAKKHQAILRNILMWISEREEVDRGADRLAASPLLLIDDEADQASIDYQSYFNEEERELIGEPTTINALIRGILSLHERAAHVGYTATPFANILIHDMAESGNYRVKQSNKQQSAYEIAVANLEKAMAANRDSGTIKSLQNEVRRNQPLDVFLGSDLFPSDFIRQLSVSDAYFGVRRFFSLDSPDQAISDGLFPGIMRVDHPDIEDVECAIFELGPEWGRRIKKDASLSLPPKSLLVGLVQFLIASAVRNVRRRRSVMGKSLSPNSMLIHVSPWVDHQSQLQGIMKKLCHQLRVAIVNVSDKSLCPERDLFLRSYDQFAATSVAIRGRFDFTAVDDFIWPDFSDVWSEVRRILATEGVLEINVLNGKSTDALLYDGKTDSCIIAIGGNKLSRGLTLEGLLVSYYLRASESYDTLLQMGRWFGYRAEVIDLLRVFTTDVLIDRFAHVADASENVRSQLRALAVTPGKTPKDFGLYIIGHEEMQVTAPNRLRHSRPVRVNYMDTSRDSTTFRIDRRIDNDMAAGELLRDCRAVRNASGILSTSRLLAFNETPFEIVDRFLSRFWWDHERGPAGILDALKFARRMREAGAREYLLWQVYFRFGNGDGLDGLKDYPITTVGGLAIGSNVDCFPFARAQAGAQPSGSFRIKSVAGSQEDQIGLTSQQLEEAKKIAAQAGDNAVLSSIYRHVRGCGALILMPIMVKGKDQEIVTKEGPFWGVRLMLPDSKVRIEFEVVLNPVAQRENGSGGADE